MHDIHNLKGYRSILCLNGHLPDKIFFDQLTLPIIAADGAANTLVDMALKPEIIIGDLDSVHPHLKASHPVLHAPDQDSNDYQKALIYLKQNNLLPSIVVGINGGHLDHILNNINIFMGTHCLLYSPPIKGFVIEAGCPHRLHLAENTKLSLIGIPQALVSTKGLKWELDHMVLEFPGQTSCFNRSLEPEIEFNIHQGSVLVLIYEQPTADAGANKWESLQFL